MVRRAGELELALGERGVGVPLQRWLCGELRAAILGGQVLPGGRLPSTRDLARQLGVSRGTVTTAYEQLVAEGYLTGATGSGTTVVDSLPMPAARGPVPAGIRGDRPSLSREGQRLSDSPFASREGAALPRPFGPNQPDLKAFPRVLWHRLGTRQSRFLRPDDMGYADPAGYRPLRQAIADHLHFAQRIACMADNVMIVGSVQQALDLCARLLLNVGDTALVEDPGYPGAARIFELTGACVQGVPVDACGMQTAAMPAAKLAYVTAAHQSPLGGTLPVDRRLDLLAWASTHKAVILEDDYDGEYRFDGAPLPALKSLDEHGHVIYLGTFSKLLFPALRLAYVVLPDWLVDPFGAAISLTCRHHPVFQQAVLAAFIAEGHFARHLRQMRGLYAARAQAFEAACRDHLDGLLQVPPITTGLDATAFLPAGTDDRAVARSLVDWGIEARPISFYRLSQPSPPGLVLGFSSFVEDSIQRGVAAMRPVFEGFRTADG